MEKEEQRIREASGEKKSVVNHFEAGANCQVFNGNITGCVFAMPGSTVTQQQAVADSTAMDNGQPEVSTLVACVAEVRDYFWADSSMTVIFCVCRDCYDYANNMSQFERDFRCKEGLLSNTFRDNPYMHKHVNVWAQNGAKSRVLRLVEAYKTAVEERLKS